ncbi:MAG: nuclear transport factor 2 family protein [Bacteroidota bacterium]
MTPREAALAFIDAINKHSIGAISELISDDHILVDSLGVSLEGREAIRNAWISYFYLVPDFSIQCDQVFDQDNLVALFGTAQGTCRVGMKLDPANHWTMPSAWLVSVRRGKVTRWQIYADNEPVRKILGPA